MSTLKTNSISNVAGTTSITTAEIKEAVKDKAYAQINKISGQSFGSGHQNILLDEILNSQNISLSSNAIIFAVPGVYQINLGFRFGAGGDVWTGANLWSSGTGIVGRSFGTGNISNDPGPAFFNFSANIQNISQSYYLRLYRNSGSLEVATPDTEAGRAFVSTIAKVS